MLDSQELLLRVPSERQGHADQTLEREIDRLGAFDEVLLNAGRETGERVENSQLPFRRRELAMLCFRRIRTLQKFASVHASVSSHFKSERSLYSRANFKWSRAAALSELRQLGEA